jgi:hypothetical protein
MENKCLYCNKTFSNKSNLKIHIENAKYCIALRDVQESPSIKFNCEFCYKELSSKYNLDYHLLRCSNKKDKDIENFKNTLSQYEEIIKIYLDDIKLKDEQLKELKNSKEELKEQLKDKDEQLQKLAIAAINKPTNVQNNNQKINQIINNLTPITEQHLKEQAEFLTIEHIKDGVNGYVKYALDYPLKDKIVCTDFSRRKLKYKDENGNLIEDPEMIKLSQKLFKAIEEKNSTLINEYITELHDKYNVMVMEPNNEMDDEESKEFSIKFNSITDELFKIKNQRKEINEIANGKKTEIYYDFIKDVCGKIV